MRTPLTCTDGLSAFTNAAIPAMSPPPPTGTKMASRESGSEIWGGGGSPRGEKGVAGAWAPGESLEL